MKAAIHVIALALMTAPVVASAQTGPRVEGRVVEQVSGNPVEGATVIMAMEGQGAEVLEVVTDGQGLFQIEQVRSGRYALTVDHISFGTFEQTVAVARGQRLSLLIRLSETAIELEPVVVEVERPEDRAARARGTVRRVLDEDQLGPIAETGVHLGTALSQLLPGVTLRSQRSSPGQMVCVEFRSPVSLSNFGCKAPVVLVDGVRSANPTITLNTIPVSDIHQVEVLPPGEAGLQYGSGSQYGVILIETFTGRTFANAGIGGPQPGSGLYSWALETEPYPWVRNYGLAFVVNAAAMAAGYAIAQSCLSFDDLTAHFTESSCGTLGNTGSRLALYALPQFALGYAAERAGGTDLSRGNAWRNAVAAAIMSAPGVVLALTTEADGFSGSRAIGGTMFILGAPAAAVAADRLFRRVRR